ncbi:hypothetical protein IM40_09285 (plasmid) [Candidatus Paracaedimonas acanthamoebae]|nr:hypothetical protein IM40_09285 [Candidatus Paracaedimonas acanthamoebae]
MQNWFFNLKKILSQSWTLLCVPIVIYARPWLEMVFGFYSAYAFLCFLPGFVSLIAFGLYRIERGSFAPVILGLLCSLWFGSLFTYSVALQMIVPILPKNILEVFYFLEKVEVTWPLIASSSLLISLFIVTHLIKYGLTQQKKVKQENSHGSARFATSQEIKALHHEKGIPVGCLIKGELSTDVNVLKKEVQTRGSQEIIRMNPHHMVLIAPSGAGKGVGIIIPTLLDYDGPVLVTDVKAAENFHVTARRRKELGREVYALDPFKKTTHESGSINILDFLDPESEEVVDDAAMIASLLVPIPTNINGNSKHFYDRARSIIQAMILYVVCSEEFSVEEKTLFQVYKLLCQTGEDFKDMLNYISAQEDLAYGQPARVAAALLTTAPEEISGSLNTVRNELGIFDSPLIQKVTSKSTIDLNKLIQNKADLFLCIPLEKLKSYSKLMRLIVSMAFSMAQKNEQRGPIPLLMVLDEMSLLGAIPAVDEALVAGRGYGVKILAVAQNIELIQKISPEAWETFMESNLLAFIGPSGLKSSEYVSKMLGTSTIETVSKSKGENQQKGSKSFAMSENQGESQSYQGRPILTADEVRYLGEDMVLVFYKGIRPMILKKIIYHRHIAWKNKYDPNPLEE